ncbi:hypothetical protein PCANC_14019 [Puccinia coronata f. sp. avenae]|uniref:Uncharacterized protein n=1 Tax=Puccinia coronata f. sp. avenae TaxID=200324 RepID=A0A2N5S1F0_9BASI|nr:hypothetical protein PCASD_24060 [Puccinia coronata f. sp. avenae]PLW37014.1 hypothetical protein PCANC_14019 [Puccinia coronata f. sp. avenae]PLW45463.1 hypothetical protein PCASD_05953 [Puccinia coronata f. sp. avenae]
MLLIGRPGKAQCPANNLRQVGWSCYSQLLAHSARVESAWLATLLVSTGRSCQLRHAGKVKRGWHDSQVIQGGIASLRRIAAVGLPPLQIAGQTGRHRPCSDRAIKPTAWHFRSRAVV